MPGLSHAEIADGAQRVRAALDELQIPDDAAVVVMSPHGHRTGVYQRLEGDLAGFGITAPAGRFEVDEETVGSLVREARLDPIAAPLDHGILVPLLLGVARDRPVAGLAFSESASIDVLKDQASRVAEALRLLADFRNVVVIASINTSAALSPRAPLTELPEAIEAERTLLEKLEGTVDLDAATVTRMKEDGRSCSFAPLWAWAQLFEGGRADRLAYESPVGVGYLVLTAEIS